MQDKIALEEHFALAETVADAERIVGGTAWWAECRRRLLDLDELRLAEMDRFGIEFAITSLNGPSLQAVLDTGAAVELARRANDALAEAVARRPDRLAGFAALPMQDPDAAARELVRAVGELGFKGALVNGFTQRDDAAAALYYDLPEYRAFWASVAELDVPFYLHPRTPFGARAQNYDGHPWLLAAAWGFGAETSLHALRLMGSGLFDEFPGLQIVLGHLGEHVPYDIWRVDHWTKRMPLGYPAQKPMYQYFRENFHITTSGNFHDTTLHCALAEIGTARTMFSVDYPFEDTIEAATWFDATEMDAADKRRIGRTNAIELFKLELS